MKIRRGTYKKCGKCRKPHTRKGPNRFQAYCESCHAAYMRENRPPYKELSDEQKKKDICRSYASYYKKRGELIQEPCNCGNKNSQMHHEDYDKPLEVNWLCRKCHLELHKAA